MKAIGGASFVIREPKDIRAVFEKISMDLAHGVSRTPLVRHALFSLWNETGAARLHHVVEPLSGLNSTDLIERVVRESGDVEILPRASGVFRRGEQSRAALYRPGQQYLSRRLPFPRGD